MQSEKNKEKLPEDASPGPESQPVLVDDSEDSEDLEDSGDSEDLEVDLEDIRKDVECPICLGVIKNTRVVMECLHRFCKECIERSFRIGNNECPTCRTHCSSRRSLREDTNFDTMISILFGDVIKEEEELCTSKGVKNNNKRAALEKNPVGKPVGVALEKKPVGISLEKKTGGVAVEKDPVAVALEKKFAGIALGKNPVGKPVGVASEKKPGGVGLGKNPVGKPVGVALEKNPVGVALGKNPVSKPVGVALEKNHVGVALEKNPVDKPVGVVSEKEPVGVASEKKPVGVALEKKPVGVASEKKPVGVALEKKPAAAASTSKKKSKKSKRATRRSPRNIASASAGSSSNRESALPPIAEEKETEVTPDTNKSESETKAQSPKNVTNAAKTVDETKEGDAPQVEAVKDIISFADKLVWGNSRHRSYNRNNSRNAGTSRNNRLARFVEHLQNTDQKDDELEIFIKLVSFEENRVPTLARPYLSCKPTLSIKQLCQYIAHETSLQTEEIELYLVKECEPDIISGDGKLDQDNTKVQFLAEEEQTMAELKTNNLNFGHLVIAYKRRMWNLNELSLGE